MKNEIWEKIKEVGESWIGTPYFHMARKKGAGADCALFLACVYEEAGLLSKVEDLYYSKSWMITGQQELMIEGFQRHLQEYLSPKYNYKKIQEDNFFDFKFERGDILCLTTPGSLVCHHAAMYFGEGKLLHAYQRFGVGITQLKTIWLARLRCVFRVFEVENA